MKLGPSWRSGDNTESSACWVDHSEIITWLAGWWRSSGVGLTSHHIGVNTKNGANRTVQIWLVPQPALAALALPALVQVLGCMDLSATY